MSVNRFFIYSPGRAGSTAIANELSATVSVVCFQEPFVNIARFSQERRDIAAREYRKRGICRTDPYAQPGERGRDIYNYGTVSAVEPGLTPAAYLDLLESHPVHQDKLAIGFKAVKGQIDFVPGLWAELARRGYLVFCLTRRNFVHGALSAAIAQQKGLYNTNDAARVAEFRSERVRISVPALANFVREYRRARWLLPWKLRVKGFRVVTLSYEDFVSDRPAFYERVFASLGVPFELPPSSSIQKLVPPDLPGFIENYAEIESFLKRRFLLRKLNS